MNQMIIGFYVFASVLNTNVPTTNVPSFSVVAEKALLGRQSLDLTTRLPNEYGAQVFGDNILLALHYLKGDADLYRLDGRRSFHPTNMNWEKIREPFEVSFVLAPNEVFAYHGNVLPDFKDRVAVSMNSRFFIEEGYKSLAGLGGNGVCHLASLINWVAADAGLEVTSKVNHDFYPVPGVPREFGTSIRYAKEGCNSQNQNLYLRNNFDYPVIFTFRADGQKVVLSIEK